MKKILYKEKDIEKKIDDLLDSYMFKNVLNMEDLVVVVLLNGGVWYGMELLRRMEGREDIRKVGDIRFLRTKSYRGKRRGEVWVDGIGERTDYEGKNVLIVDDVWDSGETIKRVEEVLRLSGAKKIYSTVLIEREKEGREKKETLFPVIIHRGEEFFEGWGMDDVKGGGRNRRNIETEV